MAHILGVETEDSFAHSLVKTVGPAVARAVTKEEVLASKKQK